MAYYNKQEILDYVSKNLKDIESRGLQPLNPEAQVIKELNDEDDMVGFFWLDFQKDGKEGEKISMKGQSWYRINHNLYTDDRFAIDLYQAMKAGINVTDVINKREQDKELARQGIVNIQDVENKLEENINKDGVE